MVLAMTELDLQDEGSYWVTKKMANRKATNRFWLGLLTGATGMFLLCLSFGYYID